MTRDQLCHVLRAAANVVGVTDLVVVGSQAVLGTYPEWRLPDAATRSVETDIVVDLAVARLAGGDEALLADMIDGPLGDGSQFHRTFGYYAQGTDTSGVTLTEGWRDRLVPLICPAADGAVVGWCLEVHDVWIAKAAAGRTKDFDFCLSLVTQNLVQLPVIEERIAQVPARDRAAAATVLMRARVL